MKKIKKNLSLGFSTKAIHVGQTPDPITGAVVTPITLATTYIQQSPGQHKGYDYSRTANPTRQALENCLSALENGRYAFATSSGVAACSLVFELLHPGDLLIAEKDLYGGTLRLFEKVLKPRGIRIKLMDLSRLNNLKKISKLDPKMVWIESPTNPEIKLIDIKKIGQITKSIGALLSVDNTLMSPFFQKPLELGADIAVHSATKYLSGHCDILGGAIITSSKKLAEKFSLLSNSIGPVLSPFDSYLLLRSLKTLSLRMKAHEKNATKLAQFLEKQSQIKQVLYPGLKSHPQHQLALKQMSGFGGMMSIYIQGSKAQVFKLLKSFQIFTLAESLGGVKSLIEHPATMTHASSPHPPDMGLVRISVGVEDIEDLKIDFLQALKKL